MQYRTVIILSSARFNSRKISFIAAARCIMRSTNRAERRAGIAIFDRIGVTETGIKGNRILILHTPLFRPELYRGEIPRSYRTVRRLMHHWTTLHRRRRQPRYSYGRPLAPASISISTSLELIIADFCPLLSVHQSPIAIDYSSKFLVGSSLDTVAPRYTRWNTCAHIHIYIYIHIHTYTLSSRGDIRS